MFLDGRPRGGHRLARGTPGHRAGVRRDHAGLRAGGALRPPNSPCCAATTTNACRPRSSKGTFAVLRRGAAREPRAPQGPGLHVGRLARRHGGLAGDAGAGAAGVRQRVHAGFRPDVRVRHVRGGVPAGAGGVPGGPHGGQAAGPHVRGGAVEPARANVRATSTSCRSPSSPRRSAGCSWRASPPMSIRSQQFTEWGGIAWLISFVQAFGALALMLIYSWQLSIVVVLLVVPLVLVVRLDAGAAVGGVRRCADPRGRDAERGLRERDGRRRRARLRPGRARSTARVTRRDRRRTAEVVAHLRPPRCGRWPACSTPSRCSVVVRGRDLRASGGSRSAGRRRSCSWRSLPGPVQRPARDLQPRPRPRSPAGARSWRCWTCRSRSRSPTAGVRAAAGRPRGAADDVRTPTATAARAARHHVDGAGRRQRRHRGRDRVRQDHVRQAADAARRPRGRHDPGRRRRPARGRAGVAAARRVRMVPQDGFLFDGTVRENVRVGPRGRDRTRRGHGLRGARARRLGRGAARGSRHRASASGARPARWASGSSSRWFARRSPTPGC